MITVGRQLIAHLPAHLLLIAPEAGLWDGSSDAFSYPYPLVLRDGWMDGNEDCLLHDSLLQKLSVAAAGVMSVM